MLTLAIAQKRRALLAKCDSLLSDAGTALIHARAELAEGHPAQADWFVAKAQRLLEESQCVRAAVVSLTSDARQRQMFGDT